MDLTHLNDVINIDDVLRIHVTWLFATLPIIWSALAGAFVRLLLVQNEPLRFRAQNAAAGMLLAATLTDMTTELLSGGDYATGYAVMYGMLGREIFITVYDFAQSKARPFLLAVVLYIFPFLKPVLEAKKEKDNHDDLEYH